MLARDDGGESIAKWKPSMDPFPALLVEGQVYGTAPAFTWYESIPIAAPLTLMTVGGALGGAIGWVGAYVNAHLLRAKLPLPVCYLATAMVTLATFVICFACASWLDTVFHPPT